MPDESMESSQSPDLPATKNDEIESLFDDVKKFNNKFSIGGLLSSAITSHVKAVNDGEDNPQSDVLNIGDELSGKKNEQEMNASALTVMHQSALAKLGLSIEPIVGKNGTLVGPSGVAQTGEIQLNIADKNKFLSFLQDLTPNEARSKNMQTHLTFLSSNLSKQLASANLTEPSDAILALFGSIDGIVNEYNRLGLQPEIQQLESYLTHSRQGDIKEFLPVEKLGLLQEPGKGFGPADWQNDSPPDNLRKRWTQAIEALNQTKANPKAEALKQQLEQHLQNCAAIAIHQLETNDKMPNDTKIELMKELKDAQLSLGKIN